MQIYAFENDDQYINAAWAITGRNYICPECGETLRVRGGARIQRHFYHYKPQKFCNQSGKSETHLMIQLRLLNTLPAGEAKMEVRFPEIGRIADIAWEKERIIFEVQCAPLTPDEALARTHDYNTLDWQVIWILHDNRYLQNVQSSLEAALAHTPHYYTNINARGIGIIYDQVNVWENGRLASSSYPKEISLQNESVLSTPSHHSLRQRTLHWKIKLADDYLSLWHESPQHSLWLELDSLRKTRLKNRLWRSLTQPYRLLLGSLLESCCKRS
ncbi:MAG: competence protein CoiA family protein [Parachlamydiales bacterium]|jgi:competence protein CoiA